MKQTPTKTRRRALSVVSILLAAALVALTGCSSARNDTADYRSELVEPGVLTIGTSGNYAPYTMMVGGRPTGYAVDECLLLAERMGLKAKVRVLDFNAIFTALQSGQIDVACSSITQTSKRKAASGFYLSTPTEVDPTAVLTLKDNDATKVSQADGAALGGISGGAQAEILKNYFKTPQDMTLFPGLAEAVLALEQRRVEYVAVGRLVGSYFVAQHPKLKLVPDVINPVPGGLAIAPRPALRDEINNKLQTMLGDGTIPELQKTWFHTTGLPSEYPDAVDHTPAPKQAFWTPVTANWELIWKGVLLTILLTTLALGISTVLGLPLGILRDRGPRWARSLIAGFSWLMRGLPALVLLFLVFYGFPTLGWSISAFGAALIALSVQATGYILEIVRGGLRSVDSRQYDATRALGLPRLRAWRQVILPQALPAMVPPYFSNSIQLLKATSLASVITVQELTGTANNLIGSTYAAVQLIITSAIIYIILSSLGVVVQHFAERLTARKTSRSRVQPTPILQEVH